MRAPPRVSLLALATVALLSTGCFDRAIEGGSGDKGVVVRNMTDERVRAEVQVFASERQFVEPDAGIVRGTLDVPAYGSAYYPFSFTQAIRSLRLHVEVGGASATRDVMATNYRLCPIAVFDVSPGNVTYAGCGPAFGTQGSS